MSDPTRIDSGAGTRLDPPNADGKTRIDRPEGPAVLSGHASIPSALVTSYLMVEPITTQGAEADLFIIESVEDKQKYVLKLYRRGLKPKTDVIDILRACSRDHVIEIVNWGESDGLWFEILEYAKHGTLRDMFRKGPVKDVQMLSIVRDLLSSIEHIHSRKIIHRDLKPENILVRTLKPLDLMLADFGIASLSDATQHFTTKSRTIKYGAPEAAAGSVGTASDYWSLGLIIFEGLTGKHPFDGLSDLSIAVQLATKGVDVAEIKNGRWRGLCKGLLTRDPKKRWAFEQVSAWLEGGMPDVPADELERPSQKPYKIAKRECWTAAELALEFGSNWSEGEKHLARNLVLPWLRDELRDQDAANLLIDLAENRSLNVEDRLLRLVAHLGKGLPPVWRGLSLDQATLVSLCREAAGGNSEKAELVETLFVRGILDVWGESSNEDCAQWSKQWKNSVKFFSARVKQIVETLGLKKIVPDQKTYLPSILLLILSSDFRNATRTDVLGFAEQASRCPWMSETLKEESFTALLVLQLFRDEAVSLGNQEIQAANSLAAALDEIEREYADLLTPESQFRRDVQSLRTAIAENRALKDLTGELPGLKRRMFDAVRSRTVAKSFKTIRRRFVVEILADGILVACLFVGIRMWMGVEIADDGFGAISARLATMVDSHEEAKKYLFAGFAAITLVWIGLRSSSRRLAKKLFGK
ncbi:MAG: protein kinase [Betaproteobacteria bacterium]